MDIKEALEKGIITRSEKRLIGLHPGITGKVSDDLRGNCSDLWGNCSDLRGDCSGLKGEIPTVPAPSVEQQKEAAKCPDHLH